MSRHPRLVIPDVPLHVMQRGVDRGPTFFADDDYAYFRWALRVAANDSGCAVHAYVLMTNHFHLLVTPRDARAASRLVQALGQRYVRYFNQRYRRTGTLWEGRFRSSVVDSTDYFFDCSRYIELNPVRASLVASPAQHPWSSFACNALGAADPVITPHAEYEALGVGRHERRRAYRALFERELESAVITAIRAPLHAQPRLNPTPYRQLLADAATASHEAARRATAPD